MSFICEGCFRPQETYDKPVRFVSETREKIYPKRYAKDGKTVIDNGGKGIEIVKEMNLCGYCSAIVFTNGLSGIGDKR